VEGSIFDTVGIPTSSHMLGPQLINLNYVLLTQLKVKNIHVLYYSFLGFALRQNDEIMLYRPPQTYLRNGFFIFMRKLL